MNGRRGKQAKGFMHLYLCRASLWVGLLAAPGQCPAPSCCSRVFLKNCKHAVGKASDLLYLYHLAKVLLMRT